MAKIIYEHDDGKQATFEIEPDLIRDSEAQGGSVALDEIFKILREEIMHAE